jgi:hypothetical protein
MNHVEHGAIDTSGDAGCRYLALRVIEQAFVISPALLGRARSRKCARVPGWIADIVPVV